MFEGRSTKTHIPRSLRDVLRNVWIDVSVKSSQKSCEYSVHVDHVRVIIYAIMLNSNLLPSVLQVLSHSLCNHQHNPSHDVNYSVQLHSLSLHTHYILSSTAN